MIKGIAKGCVYSTACVGLGVGYMNFIYSPVMVPAIKKGDKE